MESDAGRRSRICLYVASPTRLESLKFGPDGKPSSLVIDEETCEGVRCHKYKIDGPGLENRGGLLWMSKIDPHIIDYEIDLPDEPGYQSGKLRLERTEQMTEEEWLAFTQRK